MNPSAVYVYLEKGICTGSGLRTLCEKLNERGLNVAGAEFKVYGFYTDEYVATIKFTENGDWMKLVPEHWQAVIKKKKNYPKPKI